MEVSRRLVAVFAADVEGYSRLKGTDEVGTLKGLTERRAILDRIIGEHRGRIANTAGDSVLAAFGSAVDAVLCAVTASGCFGRETRDHAVRMGAARRGSLTVTRATRSERNIGKGNTHTLGAFHAAARPRCRRLRGGHGNPLPSTSAIWVRADSLCSR